ncbi:retron Ec78 anti-phage system effector HNH endonuclease PtuB [Citrobacter freundii]|uniref:retron Ec78 anti-phage system effector HNH endonuclease PtuB n=1 Tax=Citrobacter freundii TaxID=546 RepID=UPI001A281187|nr:retron Ec78 anti-phage system effector HNH endonuclease PtuB [Citrobacter freundii]WHE71728.1 TIGR02646 family protein [Citrobacter freundii]WHE76602.1 TIGR02646 family protein [Citrobacter freundii]HAT3931679.1 TIGR02646 family protein [Citrobacter freundii]HAT3936738.1 TIGR02646 family protein [Citrobacter freundii]
MKKLNRSLAVSPSCLINYSHLTHKWSQLTEKRDVWNELDKFQQKFCVYCESIAEKGNGHIEHFFHKADPNFAPLTFDWDNLFGCCASNIHCGHYKDQLLIGGIKRSYDPNSLIKPDIEDPENFLQFSDSGKIKPIDELTEPMRKRAENTISALNLDCSALNLSRKNQIKRYKDRLLVLTSIDDELLMVAEYMKIYSEAMSTFHRTALKQAIPW